mgnify:CR=1 FL=1
MARSLAVRGSCLGRGDPDSLMLVEQDRATETQPLQTVHSKTKKIPLGFFDRGELGS